MHKKLMVFLSFVAVVALLTAPAGSVSARQPVAGEASSPLIALAETNPPTVTHTLTGTLGLNGWYLTPVVVDLVAADLGGSGVDYIEWWLEGQVTPPTLVYAETAQLTLPLDGMYMLHYRAADKDGNLSIIQDVEVKIDLILPVVTHTLTGTLGLNGWYTSDVVVDLVADDALGSGIDYIEWWLEGQVTPPTLVHALTAQFTLTADGTHTVHFRAADLAGNLSATQDVVVKIDKTLPVVTHTLAGTAGLNGWYTSPVKVTLTATDAGAGVDYIEWWLEGQVAPHFIVYGTTTDFTLPDEGILIVHYRAADLAGNLTAIQDVEVKIDWTVPTVNHALSGTLGNNGWYVSPVKVTLTAADALSGVDYIEWWLEGQVTPHTLVYAATAEVTFTEDAYYTFHYRAADKAGNVSAIQTVDFKIDQTPPVITVLSPLAKNYLTSEKLTIDFTVTDNLSGVDTFTATLDGLPVTNGQEFDLLTMAGVHIFHVVAYDKAGNMAEVTVTFKVLIHATLDLKPETLNLKSNGGANSGTMFVEFPWTYDVGLIDTGSVTLTVNGVTFPAQVEPTAVTGPSDNHIKRMMKFNRQFMVMALMGAEPGMVEVTINGALTNGLEFTGSDMLKIIKRGNKHYASQPNDGEFLINEFLFFLPLAGR